VKQDTVLYLLHTRPTINSVYNTSWCHEGGWLRHSGWKTAIRCQSVADATTWAELNTAAQTVSGEN